MSVGPERAMSISHLRYMLDNSKGCFFIFNVKN